MAACLVRFVVRSPLVEIRENPEFHDLMRMDKSHWSPCLLWHGWLPLLSGTGDGPPWADSADDAAVYMLGSALGSHSSDTIQGWDIPQSVDWDSAATRTPPSPDVWTDGSLIRDEVSGSACAGAGIYARLHADNSRYRRWGHFDDLGLTPDGLMLLMLDGIFLVSVGCGILLFCFYIVSLLPFLVLSSIVMTLLVWSLILLFGLLGAFLRGAASLTLFEMLL